MKTLILDELEREFSGMIGNLYANLDIRNALRNADDALGDTDGSTLRTRRSRYWTESDITIMQGHLNRCKKILSKYGKELRKQNS